MFKFTRVVFIVAVTALFSSAATASGDNPVVLLTEAKGEVMYSPAEPFIKKLSRCISPEQLEPIKRRVNGFDFDGAREETLKLAKSLDEKK